LTGDPISSRAGAILPEHQETVAVDVRIRVHGLSEPFAFRRPGVPRQKRKGGSTRIRVDPPCGFLWTSFLSPSGGGKSLPGLQL